MSIDRQHEATSQTPSLSLRVLAGAVVAVLAAATVLVAEGVLASWANGAAVDADQLVDTLATGPYVVATVLLLGIPVALLLEMATRRVNNASRLGLFAVVGFGAGLVASWVLLSEITLLFAWPALAAAVAGRGAATVIARRVPVFVVLTVAVLALTMTPLFV